MEFQQIRGATIKVTYNGKIFLIDPFFAPKNEYPPLEAGPFPEKRWPSVHLPTSIENIVSDINAVIVTHLHPDHFDEFAVNGADAQFKEAPKAKVIVTHLDAVPHAMVGRKEVNEMVRTNNLSEQVIIPDDGEIVIV